MLTEVEPRSNRGQATREAILMAAEASFAEHGFDGARIDGIAEASGYNKTLIFRYFGDKLGLYTTVLKRSDQELSALFARLFMPLLEDDLIASDARTFRTFLTTTFGEFFDYMLEHRQFARIINWEQAEGWKTFERITTQFEPDDLARLQAIFAKARDANVLRPDIDIAVVIVMAYQLCWSSATALPLYQPFMPGQGFAPEMALDHLRTQVIAFIVAGMMNDASETT